MTKPVSKLPIENHSNKSWKNWLNGLNRLGAIEMSHQQIVNNVVGLMNNGWWDLEKQPKIYWWAQNISIAYEQDMGLRAVGQQSDGLYVATVSKTVNDDLGHWFKFWDKLDKGREISSIRTSHTPKRSYWRGKLANKTKLEVAFKPKENNKISITVTQSKITNPNLVADHKKHWGEVLNILN